MIKDVCGDKMRDLVIVRGGGDIATGTIYKLYKCGFKVLVLEMENPSAIRRNVAFSEAVYQGVYTVEDVTCILARNVDEAVQLLEEGKLAMCVDPEGKCINELQPMAVVDGILAKKNLGTNRKMAPITVGLGPGFCAEMDVDVVIETMRGHNLGRAIYQGAAVEDTKIPGEIMGYSLERVIRSPKTGVIKHVKMITDIVKKDEIIALLEQEEGESLPIRATMDGILRGMIREGYVVTEGMKIADIDPRIQERENCNTISDKARCIAGGVVEAIMYLKNKG